jgi:hypothetical protein
MAQHSPETSRPKGARSGTIGSEALDFVGAIQRQVYFRTIAFLPSTTFAQICILNADVTQAKEIMDGDPSVIHGIFRYEVFSCVSFPGDALPKQ